LQHRLPCRENEHKRRHDHAHNSQASRHSETLKQTPPEEPYTCARRTGQRDGNEDFATEIERRDDYNSEDYNCDGAEQRHKFFRSAGFKGLVDHKAVSKPRLERLRIIS
jgi:hypothetical protein